MIIVVLLLLLALFFRTLYRIHADKAPIVKDYIFGEEPKLNTQVRIRGVVYRTLEAKKGLNVCALCDLNNKHFVPEKRICHKVKCLHVEQMYYKKV